MNPIKKITIGLTLVSRNQIGQDTDLAVFHTSIHPTTRITIGPECVMNIMLPRDQMDQLCNPDKTIILAVNIVPSVIP